MTDEDAQVTEEQWDKEGEEWRRNQANIEHVEGKAAQISNYKPSLIMSSRILYRVIQIGRSLAHLIAWSTLLSHKRN
jgi:hypothetical protein